MARKKKLEVTEEDLIRELDNIKLEYETMAKKLNKLSKVNENISINRYDNGWMVEVGGRDDENDWKTAKILCNTEEEMLAVVREWNSMEVAD
jgi:hypothetical protein